MEVGSISIVGKLDVSSINDSLSQLNSGFGKVKDTAKNSFGDISNLSKSLGGITKGLVGIGLAAGTAMVGLAAVGPYTAGAMARIGVTMGELSRTISSALAPAFETFADLLQGFSSWLSSEDGIAVLKIFSGVLDTIAVTLGLIGSVVGGATKGIKEFVKESGTNVDNNFGSGTSNSITSNAVDVLGPAVVTTIGTAILTKNPFLSLLAGGATGLVSNALAIMDAENPLSAIARGMAAGMMGGGATGALVGSVLPGAGTVAGGVVGAVAGGATGGALGWYNYYLNEQALTQEQQDQSGLTGRYT